jgi:VWFA-related protein
MHRHRPLLVLTALVLAATAVAQDEAPAPIAMLVETEPLGRSMEGTVMGVLIRVAPEDVKRLGERVRVETSLLEDGRLIDRQQTVVEPQLDGTILLYREIAPGTYELRVALANLDDEVTGAWVGRVDVPESERPFEAPEGSTPDAVALAVTPPAAGGVHFLPPPDLGGIGAALLEVEVPDGTRSVEFSLNGEVLMRKNRAPWTVSVPLGDIIRRTQIRAVAYDARGRYLGEDAIVLNNPTGRVGVEILIGPDSAIQDGRRPITVSVTSAEDVREVSLFVDDERVARWTRCPCVAQVSVDRLARAVILSAEAVDADDTRGDAVLTLGADGSFAGSVEVELVELPVVVLEGTGEPVIGLEQEQFTAYEDGVEVALEGFGTTADLPLSLALAVDTSGSMLEIFPQVRSAVRGFADSLLEPGDEVLLLLFSWDATVELEWTDDLAAVPTQLERVRPEGGTSLHDAVVRSLEQFRGRRGRQALVLLTDGEDTTSRTDWDIAVRYAHTMRIPVFSIGLGVGSFDFSARAALKDLAKETGGDVFFPKTVEELPGVYARIAELLRSQYLLWYISPSEKPFEAFREIRVEVDRDGVEVRTIRGYYPGK